MTWFATWSSREKLPSSCHGDGRLWSRYSIRVNQNHCMLNRCKGVSLRFNFTSRLFEVLRLRIRLGYNLGLCIGFVTWSNLTHCWHGETVQSRIIVIVIIMRHPALRNKITVAITTMYDTLSCINRIIYYDTSKFVYDFLSWTFIICL